MILFCSGVHPAQSLAGAGGENQLPDFVARDVLDDVVRRLKQDAFVLVVGESTAGKSRLAYEAMRMALSDFVVLRPGPGEPMQYLAAAVRRHRRCVIWLDELDLYLGGGGLTAARLTTFLSDQEHRRRVVIVATMRVREYDRYSARNRDAAAAELWRAGRDVLLRAGTPVELGRRWSPAELARARAAGDDSRIMAGIRQADRFGVAEVLAAGPELVEQWRTGWEPGFHPRGAALVAAAVDCRRMGLHRPVSLDVLVELHHPYLNARGGQALRPETVEAATAWATAVAYASSSLLLPHDTGYLAFDYLIDQPFLPAVPDTSWQILLGDVSAQEAYDIGWAAIDLVRPDHALQAFQFAQDHGIPDARYAYLNAAGNSGRTGEAAEQLLLIVKDCTRSLGAEHPETVTARRDHARYLGETGGAGQAASLLEDIWSHDIRQLGATHSLTLATRKLLGRFCCENGDHARGLAHLEATLTDTITAHGPRHIDTLHCRLEQARYTAKSGRPRAALNLLTTLRADLHAALGADHPLALSARYETARATGELGDPAGAVTQLDDVYTDQCRILGVHHPRLLSTRHHRARFNGDLGHVDAAIAELRDVLEMRTRLSGPHHARTLSTRLQLACFTQQRHPRQTVDNELTDILNDCRAFLGDEHPLTRRARQQGSPAT